MLMNRDYYAEINKDNREFAQLDAEYTFALCYAMVASQMGN